jgi:uncharacterized membrane protein
MEMAPPRTSTVSIVGVFDSGDEAESALVRLEQVGIERQQVSVMLRDTGPRPEDEVRGPASPVAGGAATGAAFGGLLGGLAGWMIAIGAIAIPGVGLIVGGALAATLTGIAVGAAAGGLVGALLGLGVPEEEAREYEEHVAKGRVLLTVHLAPGTEAASIASLLQEAGGYDVRIYDVPAPEAPAAADAAEAAQDVSSLPLEESDSLGTGAAGGYEDGLALQAAAAEAEPNLPDSDLGEPADEGDAADSTPAREEAEEGAMPSEERRDT